MDCSTLSLFTPLQWVLGAAAIIALLKDETDYCLILLVLMWLVNL